MKRIVVTGALGQIGSELIEKLRQQYGNEQVLATDIKENADDDGSFEVVDVRDGNRLLEVAKRFRAEANGEKLIHRNAYNISAMSVEPSQIAAEIRKTIPAFEIEYAVDPLRQTIANSWPNAIDCSVAKEEWGFISEYDLEKMTKDLIKKLQEKFGL